MPDCVIERTKMAAKKKAAKHIDEIKKKMNKEFKKASVRTLAKRKEEVKKEVIPTGIEVLDNWVFGTGGIPVGTVGEVFGGPDSGKSSLGFHFLGAAQQAGGVGVLYETENTLEDDRPEVFGCNAEELLLEEPESADDVVAQIKSLIDFVPDGVGPNLILWDSLASAPPQAAVDGKSSIGSISRTMAVQLPVITKKLLAKRAALVVINQTRDKIGIVFGSPITTPGGNTLKFMSKYRLQMWKGTAVKDGTDIVGQYTTIKAVKNKMTFPQRAAKVKLDFMIGWIDEWSTIDLAKERGFIEKGKRASAKTYGEARKALMEKEPGWFKNS